MRAAFYFSSCTSFSSGNLTPGRPSGFHRHFATMFASSLARTAARRAATATPMRLGALRAMSSETATFDLTGSFEVRHVRSHKRKERCADCAERRQLKKKTHGCPTSAVWLLEWNTRPCRDRVFKYLSCIVWAQLYSSKEKPHLASCFIIFRWPWFCSDLLADPSISHSHFRTLLPSALPQFAAFDYIYRGAFSMIITTDLQPRNRPR